MNKTAEDIKFLQEMKARVIEGRSDITQYEMALKMIDDWIDELSQLKLEMPTDEQIAELFEISESSSQDPYMVAKEKHQIEGAKKLRDLIYKQPASL